MKLNQQDKVYEAQAGVTTGATFATEQEAQDFADKLRETWWWERFYWNGPARVEVYFSPGTASVGRFERDNDAGLIDLRPNGRNVRTLLHELAHVLAEALNDSHAHDPFWARTYGVLVYAVLGSQAWLELQSGYDACDVQYLQNTKDE